MRAGADFDGIFRGFPRLDCVEGMTSHAPVPPRRHPVQFCFALCVLAATALALPVKFDIPAQPAPAALRLFIQQSKTQVAYLESDLVGVVANAVTGDYEPAPALALLLKDTGFVALPREKGWFAIAREKARTGTV